MDKANHRFIPVQFQLLFFKSGLSGGFGLDFFLRFLFGFVCWIGSVCLFCLGTRKPHLIKCCTSPS